jgi:hypothetical protein
MTVLVSLQDFVRVRVIKLLILLVFSCTVNQSGSSLSVWELCVVLTLYWIICSKTQRENLGVCTLDPISLQRGTPLQKRTSGMFGKGCHYVPSRLMAG